LSVVNTTIVAEVLHELADARILEREPQRRARHPDFRQARTDGRLTGDEGGPAGGAALLTVEVREHRPLFGDAIEIGRPIAHHAVVVATEIEPADVVRHDEQDVRFL
jgi:hypothetical protein